MVEEIKKEKRKILVTGSSGMLGTDICRQLSEDYEVSGLDLQVSDRLSGECVTQIKCDLKDTDRTEEVIGTVDPDIIIHAAAYTDVDGCERDPLKAEELNVNCTKNIVLSEKVKDIVFVYISTDFVFDGNKNALYGEDDETAPLSVYGRTKLEGEWIVRKKKKHLIIRTSWLYGHNGKNFIEAILKQSASGQELKVVKDQVGSPTYTKDLAAALRELLKYENSRIWGTYHISNEGVVSWFDYAVEILRLKGLEGMVVSPIMSEELNRPAKRPAFSGLDAAKFKKLTGFNLRRWDKALKEYIDGER